MSNKIFTAINKIMAHVGAIEKKRKNTQGGSGYMFRGIDDVYLALQPALIESGVFFVPTVLETIREERQSKSGGNLLYTVVKVRYTFYADDGSSFDAVAVGEAMDSGDKSCNKAMSAALKVLALQLFCVPTEEEKDTELQTHEVVPKESQASSLVNREQPSKAGEYNPFYVVPFGKKYKGKHLDEMTIEESKGYANFLIDSAAKEKKPMGAQAQEFCDQLDGYLLYLELNSDVK